MTNKNFLNNLQKKYTTGGFALVSEKTGKEFAFGKDIKILYELIKKNKIKDSDKIVTYVPPLNSINVFGWGNLYYFLWRDIPNSMCIYR